MVRLSIVDHIYIDVVISSSTLQIGDSQFVHLLSKALAVQKEDSHYQGTEGDLSPFSLFRQSIPKPVIYEPLQFNLEDKVPVIKIGTVKVISIAASSLVHIGTTQSIETESRIKHFRHYKNVPPGYRTRPELAISTPPGGGIAPVAPVAPSLPSLGNLGNV